MNRRTRTKIAAVAVAVMALTGAVSSVAAHAATPMNQPTAKTATSTAMLPTTAFVKLSTVAPAFVPQNPTPKVCYSSTISGPQAVVTGTSFCGISQFSCTSPVNSGQSSTCSWISSDPYGTFRCDISTTPNFGSASQLPAVYNTPGWSTGAITSTSSVAVFINCYDPNGVGATDTYTISVNSSSGGGNGGGGGGPAATSLSLTPSTVGIKGSTTIGWTCAAGAVRAQITTPIGGFYTGLGATGSFPTTALSGSARTLGVTVQCFNASNVGGSTITKNLIITSSTAPTISTFTPPTSSAAGVMQGHSTTIDLGETGATACTVSSNVTGAGNWTSTPLGTSVVLTTPNLPTQSSTYVVTYTAKCTNAYGSATATTQVLAASSSSLSNTRVTFNYETTRTLQGGSSYCRSVDGVITAKTVAGVVLWKYQLGSPISWCYNTATKLITSVTGYNAFNSGSLFLFWSFEGNLTAPTVQGKLPAWQVVIFAQGKYDLCLIHGWGCVQTVTPWQQFDLYGDGHYTYSNG